MTNNEPRGEQRSRIMRAVKGRDTAPEMLVRSTVFAMGYRYRLHRSDLPGKPDLAFIKRRKAVFVHGCFWHGHDCNRGARVPKQNSVYWIEKITRNKARDQANLTKLSALGWRCLIIWECELSCVVTLKDRITEFLD
jgi:DNA mismatch endonuclease (patch repair protein)